MTHHVIDERGTRLTLGRLLGGGGQGEVFAAEEGNLAVKLIRPCAGLDQSVLRRRLERVRRLDLGDLPLARPETVLRSPHLGYTMQLVAGARPLSTLIQPDRDTASLSHWFIESGGLRGRLRVLAALGRVLHQLHSRGLVYGDLSARNVLLVGDPAGDFSLHLIDCDNLRSDASSDPTRFYTPGYAAPELLSGRNGANTLCDLHAFAVVSHECLTGIHPFVGDVVTDGEPELEERAYAGELPWVEDAHDRSNACSRGVPRDRVLSPATRELFSRAFGSGRSDPATRPRLIEWLSVFEQAADMTLHCPGSACGASYFATKQDAGCPWCGHNHPHNLVLTWLLCDPRTPEKPHFGHLVLDPQRSEPSAFAWMRLTAEVPARIETRHFGTEGEPPAVAMKSVARLLLRRDEKGSLACEVATEGDMPLRFVRRGGASDASVPERILPKGKKITLRISGSDLSLSSRAYLHLGSPETLHRVIRFGAKS